jgi:hypothetical protein
MSRLMKLVLTLLIVVGSGVSVWKAAEYYHIKWKKEGVDMILIPCSIPYHVEGFKDSDKSLAMVCMGVPYGQAIAEPPAASQGPSGAPPDQEEDKSFPLDKEKQRFNARIEEKT